MAKKVAKKTSKKKTRKPVKKTAKVPDEINFEYIKSNQFRVIRVDGAYGGIGPKSNSIQMALFSERQAIPRKETYKIVEGQLGDLTKQESRQAIIREVEVEAIIDLDTARSLREWLGRKIKLMEEILSQDSKK